jgi:hypothetical protein
MNLIDVTLIAAHSETLIWEGIRRVEEYNEQFRQPNPKGSYPLCKPMVGNSSYCERCGKIIETGIPCPAVPPDQRWCKVFDKQVNEFMNTLQKIEYETVFIGEAFKESLGFSVIDLGEDFHEAIKKIGNLPPDTEVHKLILKRGFNKTVYVDWDITAFWKNKKDLPDNLDESILEFAKQKFPEQFKFYGE